MVLELLSERTTAFVMRFSRLLLFLLYSLFSFYPVCHTASFFLRAASRHWRRTWGRASIISPVLRHQRNFVVQRFVRHDRRRRFEGPGNASGGNQKSI